MNEAILVLAYQLYSLLLVDIDEQLLVTEDGRSVKTDETLKSLDSSMLFLFRCTKDVASPQSFMDDSFDWRNGCTRIIAPQTPLIQPAYQVANTFVCHACATTCCSQSTHAFRYDATFIFVLVS